tara:strand:- start:1053 stop:1568 length:516 start_codon:yes stop_codon:yes gene_type:complete
MKQKGGNFESNYKMSHTTNINGSLTSNKIIAKGNDKGINIITQKNNNKPEHVFISLNQFVNKLDTGEKDLFSKLEQLMNENTKIQPLIFKNNLNTLDNLPSKQMRKASKSDKKGKASKGYKKRKASKDDKKKKASKDDKKKKKTNKRWKNKKNKTLKKKKEKSLFHMFSTQ